MSVFSLSARVLAGCAPFVTSLAALWVPLPMLMLGVPALVGAVLCSLLPETSGLSLKEELIKEEYTAVASEDDEEDIEVKDGSILRV